MDTSWDCVVVGGGAAGLSAALVLGRARRRTLVVDAGNQSNRVSEGIGGLLGQDTRPPADFYAAGRAELGAYPSVELRDGEVIGGERRGSELILELADGSRETARQVLLATGMDYRYPDLDGVAERWGRSVFHCPFCHGWEHRDEPLGVLDRGASGAQRAQLLRFWSDDVTLLTDGPAQLEDDDARRLREAGVAIDERPVSGLDGPGETLTTVTFADGGERQSNGLLVPVTLHQRSGLAAQLGAKAAPPGHVVADAVEVDPMFRTTAPAVFAAGDVSVEMPSIVAAIAAGHRAAAAIVHDLMMQASAGPAGGEAQRA